MDLRSRVLVEIHVERTDCVLIGEDADGAHALASAYHKLFR